MSDTSIVEKTAEYVKAELAGGLLQTDMPILRSISKDFLTSGRVVNKT
jgi:hypothetical protein